MKKKYLKPLMEINNLEVESLLAPASGDYIPGTPNPEEGGAAKVSTNLWDDED